MQLWLKLSAALLGASQLHAACSYSPPPLPSHGQGADTLGPGQAAAAVELGHGTLASWWNAGDLSDPDVNSGTVGAGRFRLGATENMDVSAVGAAGPESAFILGGEFKWRFAHFAPPDAEGNPGFHAATISGIGVGALKLRSDAVIGNADRHAFVAPYTGVLASGGIETIQMFAGLRVAASEVVGNSQLDLTLYPILAYGVQVKPSKTITLYAEGDIAAGITTQDLGDTALLVYPSIGLSVTFDQPWTADDKAPAQTPER